MLIKIKLIVAKVLCSSVVGNLIASYYQDKVPSLLIKGLKFDCSSKQISSHTKAQIFFGIYESAEYRFCKKYIKDGSNIIELGSSIGLISSFISKTKSPKNILAVEANPDLIPVIRSNFSLNDVNNHTICNKAIGRDKLQKLWFSKGTDNTTGSISEIESFGAIEVTCTTLSELVDQAGFENYVLICDIEGAEVDILNETNDGLKLCKLLIIEIHTTERSGRSYSIENIVGLIENKDFEIMERYGNSFVFRKIGID